MTSHSFKARFSPSPTGLMHFGNLRTALFNVLLAKAHTAHSPHPGLFLLRIEDTDLARSEAEFTEKLMHDLHWLGLAWQEGPNVGGEHGPYFQAQRHAIYEKYYQQLIDQKQAYWCYCSEAELAITRKSQLAQGMPPRYNGTCRNLTEEQRQAKAAKGVVPALRFVIPENEVIEFEDFIQGSKNFAANDIGDFIIKKADGSASFMFCNAVDDSLMQVTHVMRGEDHLTNTPRQLLILKALRLSAPSYGHMPLILGFDGKPLSKRNGSQSIESLREQGYFPIAINNYLARLGHHFEHEQLLSLDELGTHFSAKNIGRSPARFDVAQLNHWQKEAVLKCSDEEFWEWIAPYIGQLANGKAAAFTSTFKQNCVLPSDAKEWATQVLTDSPVWDDEARSHLSTANDLLEKLEAAIQVEGDNYQAVIARLSDSGLKGKALFLPVRSAITGRCYGPELIKIFPLMGKEALLKRVALAKQQIKGA
ncbi:MAG: glutamate--tRNA ligase [Candidatus Berkiella sp.]